MKGWIKLSRLPFLSVAILPYALGAFFAGRMTGSFSPAIFFLGLSGAILVQLVSHYSGELYDFKEDRLSAAGPFNGGSQVLVRKIISAGQAGAAVCVSLLLAAGIGLFLQFHLNTGKWTLALGISGIFCALYYSKPPLRLVSRGLGEAAIAYSFGVLAVNTGFYIQASRFEVPVFLASLPVACSIANIILINEYPDYRADKQSLKNNLLVRLGKNKTALLYAVLVLCSGAGFILAVSAGLPRISIFVYLPVFAAAAALAFFMLKGAYRDMRRLEMMCAMTIAVSLGTSLSCMAGLLKW
ncbi:MAG: prenyltransferase [Candidatus Omnitrophica bacterium]|nr:prenyltransferase [Candidatus Omnitrophota bacterium]MDD5042170.1 prenyltransferase [Candidatus Omnitrophota bacterium]MDD5500199.1 prenyltransferase [Candidatus Omnitrophota bacterium]